MGTIRFATVIGIGYLLGRSAKKKSGDSSTPNPLMEAAKTALATAATNQFASLSQTLNERTEALQPQSDDTDDSVDVDADDSVGVSRNESETADDDEPKETKKSAKKKAKADA